MIIMLQGMLREGGRNSLRYTVVLGKDLKSKLYFFFFFVLWKNSIRNLCICGVVME